MVAEEKRQKYPTFAEVVEELKRTTDVAFPIATMGLVGYLKNMILVICMGTLGSLELAGGSLAIGFTNITGYSVLAGLAMGMEPLCSQAFGSQNFSIALLTLQRTILILLLISIPIGLLWINLEPLMLILHQNPDIARVASSYCRHVVPDLIVNSLIHPIRIYLRNKGIAWPPMWCTLLAIFFHIPITIFLTFTLNLGVKGIAISNVVTNVNTLSFLLIYLTFFGRARKNYLYIPLSSHPSSTCSLGESLNLNCTGYHEESDQYSKFTAQANFQGLFRWVSPCFGKGSLGEEWGALIKLAIPSCLGVCLEWWWYEFMTILAGYLHNPRIALATSAIVIQTTSLMYSLPIAISGSVSTRVGNELGAGRPGKARLATCVAIGLALMSSILGFSWTTLGREIWGRVFTKDSEVLELTMAVLPIIGLCELANCPQTASCGILRGSARPGVGALINFCSFYLVGAPVAVVLAFVWKLGFVGLCYGLLAAQIACAVSILIVVYNTDWERESVKAKDLMGKSDVFGHANQLT